MSDTPRGSLGTVLVIVGTAVLFCAGFVGPLIGIYVSGPGSTRPLAPLVAAIVMTALVAAPGAALVAYGRAMRNGIRIQPPIGRFAGNLLLAIGIVWMVLSGSCALFFTQIPGSQTHEAANAMLVPFAGGAILCIIGQALKRAQTK